LRITEIKAFVPSKNFELSKQFYQDLGFTMDSDDDGIAYFHFENVSFLLQDYCVTALAENFMMHILVEDVDAWWEQVRASGVVEKYGGKCVISVFLTHQVFCGELVKTANLVVREIPNILEALKPNLAQRFLRIVCPLKVHPY
jgi:hypothetical protein